MMMSFLSAAKIVPHAELVEARRSVMQAESGKTKWAGTPQAHQPIS
jgi:hypothetical protein